VQFPFFAWTWMKERRVRPQHLQR